MPSMLYKYRDDSSRTEDIFRTRKIWLSSPDQLNDPLECRAGQIPADWQAETIRKMEEGQLMGMVGLPGSPIPQTLFSLDKRQTRKWWARLEAMSHREKVRAMRKIHADHGIEISRPEAIFDDMRQRLAQVGVFSLSETCENELMWAHYADSHRGLTIGFARSAGCKLSNERHTMPVTYAKEKPKFTAGFRNELSFYAVPGGCVKSVSRISFEDDVFRASLCTKTPAWGYEREWRYVEESHGLFDWPGVIESITFGLRMSSARREFYRELVGEFVGSNVQYYEVNFHGSTNELVAKKV